MSQFIDNNKRTWQIDITIGSVKRVKSLLGVNLLEIEAGDPPLAARLASDEILLCDVIYCLIKPQADELGITDEQFGQSLGGDAILDAQHAFYQELKDFFQKRGRTDRAKMLEKQHKMLEAALMAATAKVEQIDTDKLVEKTLGKSSMNLPE